MEKVYIRRAGNFTALPDEYVDAGKVVIGGCAFGESPLTGLTEEEIVKYMPSIIGVSSTSDKFRERVNAYFANIEIKIPSGSGLELKVGLDSEGRPKNLVDYIRYKYALAYPDCANSEEIALGGGYLCFIYDEQIKINRDYDKLKKRREAQALYLEVSSDMDTVDMILTLLGDTPAMMEEPAKMIALETAANAVPEKFAAIAKDKNLGLKSKIAAMVTKKVIERSGNTYFFNNEPIGNHSDKDPYKEIVIHMKNPANSENYLRMFAKLGEEPLELKARSVEA